jgi:hypothetical protein
MSFLNLEVIKGKPTKSKGIMPHLKLSKNMLLEQRNWKKKKIGTHMDLWKYGQILTIQKSLIIKRLRFSKNIFLIWLYHLVLHYILSPNNKFGMWININFSINCDVPVRRLVHIFWLQKSITTNKWFLSINNHKILLIMKLFI